ncbi:long-chain fatty acid--CoA ligase [Streptomyces sp. NPDC019224]|uniref:long-chain-fatty-acid--CoA ligase n=1 Tax=Streptomyces sp. NPDC019224 TaxID=3154484 RepID=UPI0033C62A38
MTFNLATMLRESALKAAGRPLLLHGESTCTYGEADAVSGRIARALRDTGLRPGERVAVQLPNIVEFPLAYFGVLKAGLVMVPLNPLLTARELAHQLSDSGARTLITTAPSWKAAAGGLDLPGHLRVYCVGAEDRQDLPATVMPFTDLCRGPARDEIHPTSADDTAVILYTSGTTGAPKGAELTHFQLYMNCTVSGGAFGLEPADRTLAALPFFHAFGLSSVLNTAVRFGSSLVLVPRFEATAVADAMERHGCTLFVGVPTMYVALLQADRSGRDTSSLRAAISAGAAIPAEVVAAFEKAFTGCVVLEGYGISETAAVITFNAGAEERRIGSVGKPIWGVEVRVVDGQGGPLPPGADRVGEILVRGHNVMKGYHERPEETAAAIREGWFATGDLGYLDHDGYLHVVDRLKDLVIRGGYNVYPREVEEVLHAHPAVAEAAVVGRPDDRLGEQVVAFVTLAPEAAAGPEELIAHCREHLAAYKYPREITVLEALPKGPTGKILKRALRG